MATSPNGTLQGYPLGTARAELRLVRHADPDEWVIGPIPPAPGDAPWELGDDAAAQMPAARGPSAARVVVLLALTAALGVVLALDDSLAHVLPLR